VSTVVDSIGAARRTLPWELVSESGDRVHVEVFTSEAIFALELQRIFERTWVYVGHTSELPRPGSFKTLSIGRQPIVLTRTDEGVRAFYNACRHRGTLLCAEATGEAKRFQCPYHGWTFGVDGRLHGVPWPEAQPRTFDKDDWGLVPVGALDEHRGFLFASLDPEVAPLQEHLGLASGFIDGFSDLSPSGRISLTGGTHRYQVRANWKQVAENAVDGYHPATTHWTFFEALKKRTGIDDVFGTFGYDDRSETKVWSLGNGHALFDIRHVDRSRMFQGQSAARDVAESELRTKLEAALGKERADLIMSFRGGDGFNLLVYPNLVLINSQVRVINPRSVAETEVEARVAYLEDVDPALNEIRLRQHEDFYGPAGFGTPDDWEMLERQSRGLLAKGLSWVPYERGIEREQRDPGTGAVFGKMTDEVSQRGMWRRWRSLMAEGGGLDSE
jgi:phenylpropionate dioxygenase-like ring-hydroxylating dioxygenase large terminal subunit